ncbi:DUF4232 domain-containing protein [Micromonospora sp. NPDC023737]|uniref:DUF4232 domain-containing protein n=1 Tax=unclassified Micromonospora TaxID=2617518 RepID=UPI0034119738
MTPRPARRQLLLTGLPLAAALLLGACTADHAGMGGDGPVTGGRPGAGPTAPGNDPTGACPESGVLIRSTGSDAAMGLRALGLELINCGTADYPLHGYPSLRLLDGEGTPIPVQVIEGAKGITSGFDDPPRPLTLRPGERAGAAVLWRNLVTDSTVVATDAEGLEVAPGPGLARQAVDPDGPIDLGNTGRIGVSAWKEAEPTTPATPPAPSQPSGAPSVAVTPDSRL